MRTLVTTMLISALLLTACGRDSRMNPRNWFGSSKIERRATPADGKENNPLIPEARDSIFRRKADGEVYKGTPIHAIADVTIDLYVGLCVLSRADHLLRSQDPEAEAAVQIAELFSKQARRRMVRNLRGIRHNEDATLDALAGRIIERGKYVWDVI